MSSKLESVEAKGDVAAPMEAAAQVSSMMRDMGRRARAAARALALAAPEKKTGALKTAAQAIRDNASAILRPTPKTSPPPPRTNSPRLFATACRSTQSASPPWPTVSISSPIWPIQSAR